ncbi:MAG: hypothetical protein SF182_13395 [Deltaproteobacteria bacterium]|nr:hypothetical protein [Deltaproteobacteria bacterium]
MTTDAFLLCSSCGVLQPLRTPGPWPELDPEAAADLIAFRQAHEAHGLREAQRLDERGLTDLAPWEPMATRWFRVRTGAEVLAVRSWRWSIEEPRLYAVDAAGLPAVASFVDVDEALLRRALDRHFYPQVIRGAQIDGVCAAVRELLAPLDPQQVETSFDDATLPDAAIGPFPAALREALLERCAALFDARDLTRLRGFVADHQREDGALAVRVRRVLTPRAA